MSMSGENIVQEEGSQETVSAPEDTGVTTEQSPDEIANKDTSASLLEWIRETPRSIRYGIAGTLGAAAILTSGYVMGKNSVEAEGGDTAAADIDNGQTDSERFDELGNLEGETGAPRPEPDGPDMSEEDQEVDEFTQRLEAGDKDAWLEQWTGEDYLNGERVEDHGQAARDYVNNIINKTNRKFEAVANAESEDDPEVASSQEVQRLDNVRLLLENGDGVFPAENAIIYGVSVDRPEEADGIVLHWSEQADSPGRNYSNFAIVYHDPSGERQSINLSAVSASLPSDSNTRVVGAYVDQDAGGPEIVRSEIDFNSIHNNPESYILRDQNGPGYAEITQPPVFDSLEEAWDHYEQEDGSYEPYGISGVLNILTNND